MPNTFSRAPLEGELDSTKIEAANIIEQYLGEARTHTVEDVKAFIRRINLLFADIDHKIDADTSVKLKIVILNSAEHALTVFEEAEHFHGVDTVKDTLENIRGLFRLAEAAVDPKINARIHAGIVNAADKILDDLKQSNAYLTAHRVAHVIDGVRDLFSQVGERHNELVSLKIRAAALRCAHDLLSHIEDGTAYKNDKRIIEFVIKDVEAMYEMGGISLSPNPLRRLFSHATHMFVRQPVGGSRRDDIHIANEVRQRLQAAKQKFDLRS